MMNFLPAFEKIALGIEKMFALIQRIVFFAIIIAILAAIGYMYWMLGN